ncbi:b(0,+)-type amino acid transporter 1-like isoform X3 [Clytia hemisphaerica]|uniref:b(0,+)-type amino acid transporter 1-like isoform X3 n=1 Tax=Clytia hemisphaerica TaxID=252671 RepID=UPI0034D5596B
MEISYKRESFSSQSSGSSQEEFVQIRPSHRDNENAGFLIQPNRKNGLKVHLTLFHCLNLLLCLVLSPSTFASCLIYKHVQDPGIILVLWTTCGAFVLCYALVWVELGTMFPREAGGEYTYLKNAFGPLPAFVYSMLRVLILQPARLTLICLASGDFLLRTFSAQIENVEIAQKFIAAAFIAVILIVNCLSVKWATLMQVFFTAAKMIAIVMLIITGFVRLGQGHDEHFKNAFNGTNTGISDIGYAFYGGLWAYDGWNNLNYVTEELKNPIRDLPLAIMIGIPLVTGCYVMVNVAYLTVMSASQIATEKAVAVTLGYDIYGTMAWVIPLLVACSTFGAANGSAFTSGRLVYVSAREGHMPRLLAMVHKKRHTPLPALIFTCVIAWIMLIPESSNFSTLVNYFNFAAWTFYGATVAALLWLRYKEPDLERPYRVFIGVPILVLLCSVYLVVAPFYDYPLESFYCLLFILLGIPVYFIFVHFKLFPNKVYDGFDAMTDFIERKCNLSMPGVDQKDEVDEIDKQKKEQQLAMQPLKTSTDQI